MLLKGDTFITIQKGASPKSLGLDILIFHTSKARQVHLDLGRDRGWERACGPSNQSEASIN